jgi:23S rRNA (guanosine2251-2'-O)-methyltransferase
VKANYIYGIHTVEALLSSKSPNVSEILIQQNRQDQKIQKIITFANNNGIAIQPIAKHKIDELLPNCNHQGVVAIVKSLIIYEEQDLPDLLTNLNKPPLVLILDGIQDPHNLGACLRTANAAGVDVVIAPKDNSVGLTPVVHKTACGAAEITPFIQVVNLSRTMKLLKDQGIWLYGTDAVAEKTIYETNLKGAVALVLGAEEKGMRRLTRENCDALMSIPMHGNIPSLNVSVATGICLFEIVRQNI